MHTSFPEKFTTSLYTPIVSLSQHDSVRGAMYDRRRLPRRIIRLDDGSSGSARCCPKMRSSDSRMHLAERQRSPSIREFRDGDRKESPTKDPRPTDWHTDHKWEPCSKRNTSSNEWAGPFTPDLRTHISSASIFFPFCWDHHKSAEREQLVIHPATPA